MMNFVIFVYSSHLFLNFVVLEFKYEHELGDLGQNITLLVPTRSGFPWWLQLGQGTNYV
jgi:hypothetical protein